MTSQEQAFQEFADFAAHLKGDEKSEAQTFLFHLLEAFNHDANTLPENSTFEYRVRFPSTRIKFADFVWPGRVLIEMKSRGEKLSKHYQQTFDYWLNLVPHRPPYVVLCDFDEFWIYDFNTQLQEPMERVPVKPKRGAHGVTRPTNEIEKIRAVAAAALALRMLRQKIMRDNGWSLRELYKSLETPGENRLRDAHAALDATVRTAYGMKPDEDILAFLLKLNLELADKEMKGESITPPGLPPFFPDPKKLVTEDCVQPG